MIVNYSKTLTGYTCFAYMDKLDEKSIKILNEIVINKTEDYNNYIDSWMNRFSKSSYVTITNNNISNTTKKVFDIATTFFKNAGLNVDQSNGYISYISYSYNSPNYAPYDDWIDNIYSANECYNDVHECIIVTRKDDEIKDGNMEVYKKNPNTFLNLIGYEEEEKDVYELNTGSVLVLSGDTIHKLQSFRGSGFFNYILVTLKAI
jgi:hypothetical protein